MREVATTGAVRQPQQQKTLEREDPRSKARFLEWLIGLANAGLRSLMIAIESGMAPKAKALTATGTLEIAGSTTAFMGF